MLDVVRRGETRIRADGLATLAVWGVATLISATSTVAATGVEAGVGLAAPLPAAGGGAAKRSARGKRPA